MGGWGLPSNWGGGLGVLCGHWVQLRGGFWGGSMDLGLLGGGGGLMASNGRVEVSPLIGEGAWGVCGDWV